MTKALGQEVNEDLILSYYADDMVLQIPGTLIEGKGALGDAISGTIIESHGGLLWPTDEPGRWRNVQVHFTN